jgi:hypothetical protein
MSREGSIILSTPLPLRQKIVDDARAGLDKWRRLYLPDLQLENACFYLSVFMQHSIKLHLGKTEPVLICAGSMSWPRIDMSKDDGKIKTHFSWIFNIYDRKVQQCIERNEMPEMHCWNVIPNRGEFVDASTIFFKIQCQRAGIEWLGPDPPDHLWARFDEMPKDVYYDPDPFALNLVKAMIRKTWGAPR